MNVKPSRVIVRTLLFGLVLGVALAGSLCAQGVIPIPEGPQNIVLQATDDPPALAAFQNSPAWKKFTGQYGQKWWLRVDKRNDRPAFIAGPGIRWVTDNQPVRVEGLDRQARAFMQDQAGLFRIDPTLLVLNREVSGVAGQNPVRWHLQYDVVYRGVPVLDALVEFTGRNDNLVHIGIERIQALDLSVEPSITSEQAFAAAVDQAGHSVISVSEVLDPGTRYILPLAAEGKSPVPDTINYSGPRGEGYDYRLIYQTSFRFADDIGTYVGRVDARTGEVLDLYDDNRYGQVRGGVYPRTLEDGNEVVLPFYLTSVNNNGGQVTDLGGYYNYGGGDASVVLDGAYARISDRCGSVFASTSVDPGDIDLGSADGTDCTDSGASPSARNSFYAVNTARLLAKKYLSTNPRTGPWLDRTITANVNLNQRCNAFYSGAVNFFRSGGSCNNTGEIADVIYHEWGHGLDQYTNNAGNGAKGEGVADIDSLMHTHNRCIGPGFYQSNRTQEGASRCRLDVACPTSIRDLECLVTLSNRSEMCPSNEIHCVSHILSGAVYDLSQLLVQRYGENEGWRVAERLYMLMLPNLRTYDPSQNGNAYTAYLLAADDDGDLSNGVPDGDLIYQAFNNHEIALDPAANFRALCTTPPATPAVVATPGDRRVTLTWNTIPGATGYQVLRRVKGHSYAFIPVTDNLTDTQYLDTQVGNGVTYDYIVTASINDCSSAYGSEVSATPGP